MQSLIDESVHALFAAVVEQIHKFAQVSSLKAVQLNSASLCPIPEASGSHAFLLLVMSSLCFVKTFWHQPADMNVLHTLLTLNHPT